MEKFGINWNEYKVKENILFLVEDKTSYNKSNYWFLLAQDHNNITQYLAFHKTNTNKNNIPNHIYTSRYSAKQKLYEAANIKLNQSAKYKDYSSIFSNYNLYAIPSEYAHVIEMIDPNMSQYIAKFLPSPKTPRRYWTYRAGENSRMWEECSKKNIISIGWDYLGDLKQYPSREELREKISREEQKKNPMNDSLACWEFANCMNIGDIIYVEKGRDCLIARGIVKSNYIYDNTREEYKNIRKVQWTHKELHKLDFTLDVKTLTDISQEKYGDYCLKIEAMFNNKQIQEQPKMINQSLNQILYGPPGTGKTYNTVIKAMEIIEPELIQRDVSGNILNYDILKNKFDELKKQGQIEFVTFHQSYSYEEFVEGIKPYIPEWGTVEENNRFIGQDGIFKKICNSAKTTIKGDFEKIYSQFIEEIDENYEFKTKKASFKIRVNDNDGLTIRTGDNFEKETCGTITKEQIKNQTFTSLGRKQKLEAITKYLKEKYGLKFSTSIAVKPHILIIDEINRGDVSKIFGELITLIEEDKRIGKKHQMTVTLPYSREPFGVPNNLYIIGTMNTADRSIALLDTALRRRFDFEEMMPKPELLRGKDIEGVDLEQLLTQINDRIKNEYDRDHQIGHSYLMGVENKEQLERAYKNRILPLLNEYFYNDIDSVAKILNCKPDEITSKENWFNVLKEAQKLTKKENEQ